MYVILESDKTCGIKLKNVEGVQRLGILRVERGQVVILKRMVMTVFIEKVKYYLRFGGEKGFLREEYLDRVKSQEKCFKVLFV